MDHAVGTFAPSSAVRRSNFRGYFALVLLLLVLQFALRAHHPALFPVFIDEYRHVDRAQLVYTLDHNPIEFTHGKLLLYYWIGLFGPQGYSGVIVGRLSIALASLITAAATTAIARRLFGCVPALFALAFYVLAPQVVFFERLALADPLASALAALSVWLLLHYVNSPSRRRAIIVGIVISAAVLAKLTTALLMGFPVIAVMLLNTETAGKGARQTVTQWSEALWRRYGNGLKIIGVLCLVPWVLLLVLAVISVASGNQPILFPTRMIGVKFNTLEAIRFRAEVLYTDSKYLLSIPMTVTLALAIAALLWRAPRRTLFVLAWLAVLCAPSIILTWRPSTRYLIIGYPALSVLGGAVYWLAIEALQAVAERIGRMWRPATIRVVAGSAVTLGFGLWAILFAAPFAVTASRAPETLPLPPVQAAVYYQGPNGWAVTDVLEYLEAHGERIDNRVPVMGRFHYPITDDDYCGMVELYVPDTFDWDCDVIITSAKDNPSGTAPIELWSDLRSRAEQQPFFYLVIDKQLPASLPGAFPGATEVYHCQRPYDGPTVRVWRIDSIQSP